MKNYNIVASKLEYIKNVRERSLNYELLDCYSEQIIKVMCKISEKEELFNSLHLEFQSNYKKVFKHDDLSTFAYNAEKEGEELLNLYARLVELRESKEELERKIAMIDSSIHLYETVGVSDR